MPSPFVCVRANIPCDLERHIMTQRTFLIFLKAFHVFSRCVSLFSQGLSLLFKSVPSNLLSRAPPWAGPGALLSAFCLPHGTRLVGLQRLSTFCPGFLASLGALLSESCAPHRARLVGLQSLSRIIPRCGIADNTFICIPIVCAPLTCWRP